MNAIEELLHRVALYSDSRDDEILKKWREGDWAERIMANTQLIATGLYSELSSAVTETENPVNAIEELLDLVAADTPRYDDILAKWRDGGWVKEIMRSLYRDNRALAGLIDRGGGGEDYKLLPPPDPNSMWTLKCHSEGRKFTWTPLQNRWVEEDEYNGGPA